MPAPIRPVDELGFPIPAKFEDFQVNTPEPTSPRRPSLSWLKRWRWLLLLLVPALLFGKPAVDFVRGIVANVQLQRAERDRENHNFQRAIAHASRAIDWEPTAVRRAQDLIFRATLHKDLGQYERSLRDCNEAIKILSGEKQESEVLTDLAYVYQHRGWVQFRLGRKQAAVDDLKLALKTSPDQRSGAFVELLNEKAYICALTSLDIEDGMKAVNEALAAWGAQSAAMLDTRACLEYRQGKLEAALNDMDTAIHLIDRQRQQFRRGWDADPVFVARNDIALDNESYAVILYHRGEIHRKLAAEAKEKSTIDLHKSKAESDFKQAHLFGGDARLYEALEPAGAEKSGT